MAEQKQSGLGGRPQLDALGRFRMAVMPDTKSKSLSENTRRDARQRA